jgi:hypothetical protein
MQLFREFYRIDDLVNSIRVSCDNYIYFNKTALMPLTYRCRQSESHQWLRCHFH